MPSSKSIIVVSGLGNAVGTGAAVARLFSKELGFRVALLSRPRKDVEDLRNAIVASGGVAEVFSLDTYDHDSIKNVFKRIKQTWPDGRIKTTIWNTGAWSMIPFMEIKESDIKNSVQINIVAATAFAQESVSAFMSSPRTELGEEIGGTLLVTGATSARRGAHSFGTFSAGKAGMRMMTQSIAREYGPQGVHSAYVIVDGTILTKRTQILFGDKQGAGWLNDEAQRLSPESIAKCYLYLHQQDKGCWTQEMDLRPAKEKF